MSFSNNAHTSSISTSLAGRDVSSEEGHEAFVAWSETEPGKSWQASLSKMPLSTELMTTDDNLDAQLWTLIMKAGTNSSSQTAAAPSAGTGSEVEATSSAASAAEKETKSMDTLKIQIERHIGLVAAEAPGIPFLKGCCGILEDLNKLEVKTRDQVETKKDACCAIVRSISRRVTSSKYRDADPEIVQASWGRFLNVDMYDTLKGVLGRWDRKLTAIGINVRRQQTKLNALDTDKQSLHRVT